MQKQFLTALIVVAVVGGGYWWWQSSQPADSEDNTSITDPFGSNENNSPGGGGVMEDGVEEEGGVQVGVGGSVQTGGGVSSSAPMNASVTYTGSGFSPATVTIKKGGTVTWRNAGSGTMWVASAQHPTHTVYDGTSLQEHCSNPSNTAFDQCASGDSYSFTFNKTGTWRYHDHINTSAFGSVIVE